MSSDQARSDARPTSASAGQPGRLVLIPNTLDLGSGATTDLQAVLPMQAIARAAGLRHWVVENAKTARAFLKRVGEIAPLVQPLQALHITELPRPRKGAPPSSLGPAQTAVAALLAPALAGEDVGLLSEAGMPAVADPGADLVQAAHRLGLPVEPWPGPSALLLALAASGLNGQSFAFVGYLPVDAGERQVRLRALEVHSRKLQQTQIAIETPYRNAALLAALIDQLAPTTQLAVACGLGLPGGWNRTMAVQDWRRAERPAMGERLPAVFCWLAR